MFATVLSDTALVIASMSTFTIAAAMFVAVRHRGRRIEVKLGSIQATADAVNQAVNSVPAGVAPLTQRVDSIEATLVGHGRKIDAIAEHLSIPPKEVSP